MSNPNLNMCQTPKPKPNSNPNPKDREGAGPASRLGGSLRDVCRAPGCSWHGGLGAQCESEGGCSCVRGRPAAARALSSKLVFIIGVGLVCVHYYHARYLATLIRDRRRQATALCAFCTLTHMIGVD